MRYLSVTEIAKKWDVSERSVRNYCATGACERCICLPARPGTFPRMQRSRSVRNNNKKDASQLHCWIFCRNRRQVRIRVVFTIKHRLT